MKMRHKMRNERGYTLLLVLLSATLFIMFAMMLMMMTSNGMKRDDVREDVTQATELSEKGLDRIVEEIQFELKKAVPENGILPKAFSDKLDSTINKYLCSSGAKGSVTEKGVTGDYEACVDDIRPTENQSSRLVVFRSKGDAARGTERTIKYTMEIGAAAVPDSLKYAVGTNKSCGESTGRKCTNGEGNLFMHGGVSITGDMKVDGDLITTNYGYAFINGEQWIPSLYPAATQAEGTSKARLVLGGSAYTFRPPPRDGYANHIKTSEFSGSTYSKVNPSSAFSESPLLVKREPKIEKVDILAKKKSYQFARSQADTTLGSSTISEGNSSSGKRAFAYGRECTILGFLGCRDISNFTIKGANAFKQFATDANVTISNSSSSSQLVTTENGMYVGGNLTIGNGSSSYDPKGYDKVDLSGPVYVNGNLTIKGADARLNALIYVAGTVTIQNTRINGYNANNKAGSLIVFANDEVKISNNSVDQEKPSNIRGYFYSKENFEMFGVGSNMRIEGGISAKRIVLNAVRGRSSSTKPTNGYQIPGTKNYYDGIGEQQRSDSRLQVIYNPEIINTYSDLKANEAVITEVDDPVLKKRER